MENRPVTPVENETNRIENRVEVQVAGLTRREALTACVATAVGAAALPLASGQESAAVGSCPTGNRRRHAAAELR